MHPDNLYQNTFRVTIDQIQNALFREIKRTMTDVLMKMQKDQLFLFSIGADGILLGHYTSESYLRFKKIEKGVTNEIWDMYDMDLTGKFEQSVKVKVTLKEIQFIASDEYVFRVPFEKGPSGQDVFMSKEWYGLTEENMSKLIDQYLIARVQKLILSKARYGTWKGLV